MKAEPTKLADVMRLTPRRFSDERGYFMETFRLSKFKDEIGHRIEFVQENQSLSLKANTIRGLHFQGPPHGQGKLVRCVKGAILDVAVDIRRGSENYGQWISEELSASNDRQLWIPEGFLHGFKTLEDNTIVSYQCTSAYAPQCEGAVLWNDSNLAIDWGIETPSAISKRDQEAVPFSEFQSPFHYGPNS